MRRGDGTSRSQRARQSRVSECSQSLLHRATTLVFVSLVFGALSLSAQKPKPNEFEVKATYLYNFARFVEWPSTAAAAKNDSFAICVLGQDPFGAVLDSVVTGETIDGKAVLARRVMKPQDAVSCRVLYISSSEDGRLKEILAALDKAGVLTVSDIPQFSQRGGMIQFVEESSKIRFEVNLANAGAAGLTLSSELLKVAVAVRTVPQPGD